jgi:hypothetical protein
MPAPESPLNIVVTVTAGYREEQIRPFLASLRHYAPDTSLRLLVDRVNPEFQRDVRTWFPDCSFHLLPPKPLRDYALKRKWAASILKRMSRWSGSHRIGQRLVKINYLRHLVIYDLLLSWRLSNAKILLCDSRDLVFQGNPFSGEWPLLWSAEEDKLIKDCRVNSAWFKRVGGEAALQQVQNRRIVCAGVLGGRADRIEEYLKNSSALVSKLTPDIPLTDGDQGIHNNLVYMRPDLGFAIQPNGGRLAANVGYTSPADLKIENQIVRLRDHAEAPAILHQYDRHPPLVNLVRSRWANAKPPSPL